MSSIGATCCATISTTSSMPSGRTCSSCCRRSSAATVRKHQTVMVVAIVLTVLAATLGLVFSIIVSTGLTRPVHRLLEGTRAVEAGKLDETLAVTSQDEIGYLTMAFNRMIEQLRLKERIR